MLVRLFNPVENIVTKGVIAHYEQYLFYPQCFQKSSAADVSTCDKGLNYQRRKLARKI